VTENSYVSLAPALALTLMTILLRIIQGSWLAPGAFCAVVWATLTWLGVLLAPEVGVFPEGVWLITLCVTAVAFGAVVGGTVGRRRRSRADDWSPASVARLRRVTLGLAVVGLGAALVLLLDAGGNLGVLLSPTALAGVGRRLSMARYVQGYQEPLIERIFLVAIYLSAWFSGVILGSPQASPRRWFVIVPLVPAAAVALLETTKATLSLPMVLMVSTFLAMRVRHRAGAFAARHVALAVGSVAVVVPTLIALQLIRYGYLAADPAQLSEVLGRLRVAAFGYLAVFSVWIKSGGLDQNQLSFGAYTFAGLFDLLGQHPRALGLYADQVYVGSRATSNIYTVFRGLLEDFGLGGSLVVLTVVGFIAGEAYERLQAGSGRWALPIVAVFYAASLWSCVSGIFVYNTVLLAWLLFGLYSWWTLKPAAMSADPLTYLPLDDGPRD
jgi:oligosaccharide repeat unit polymerase